MAQRTQYTVFGLPGQIRSFSAKAEAVAPVTLESIVGFELFIDQKKDFDFFIDKQKNFDMEF